MKFCTNLASYRSETPSDSSQDLHKNDSYLKVKQPTFYVKSANPNWSANSSEISSKEEIVICVGDSIDIIKQNLPKRKVHKKSVDRHKLDRVVMQVDAEKIFTWGSESFLNKNTLMSKLCRDKIGAHINL